MKKGTAHAKSSVAAPPKEKGQPDGPSNPETKTVVPRGFARLRGRRRSQPSSRPDNISFIRQPATATARQSIFKEKPWDLEPTPVPPMGYDQIAMIAIGFALFLLGLLLGGSR